MTEKYYPEERLQEISDNIKRVRETVAQAAIRAGRDPAEVRLMAVTKTVAAAEINHAISCGIDLIGENKVQEFLSKKPQLQLSGVETHMIGHLQTNKVKDILGQVDVIQSVDSLRLAQALSKRAQAQNIPCKVLLEVNIAGEESKFGFCPQDVRAAAQEIANLPGMQVRGLMTVAPMLAKKSEVCTFFINMQRLFIDIRAEKMDNITMDILSMGMSDDFSEAIAAGSTLVRLGSAIFGIRQYR